MVPAIQPIYQNVLDICLDVNNFYWLTWLNLPLYTDSFERFPLISTLDLELILSRKKPTLVPPNSGSTGKYRQKRVKDLVIENLKGKWDVSQPFFIYSRAP